MSKRFAKTPAVLAAIGACHFAFVLGCSSPAPTTAVRCAIEAPATTSGRLHVDGTQLRDESGRQVVLRGVNAGSRAKFTPYLPFEFGATDFDASLARYVTNARSIGIDVMRVTVMWAAWEPTRGTDDMTYVSHLEAFVDAAWKQGIRTILDIHQDVYSDVYCGDGMPPWTIPGMTPAPHHDCPKWYEQYTSADVKAAFDRLWDPKGDVQAAYESFLQRLVTREKDRPGVIGFELINEPNAGTADPNQFEATVLAASFYPKMVAVVNGLSDALVFLDPQGQTSATHKSGLLSPGGKNLVFAPHYYQPLTIFDGAARPDLVQGDLKALKAIGDGLGMPSFLGEWGAARDASDSNDVIAAHYAAFDSLRLGGTQWEYSLATQVWNDEKLDIANPDGTWNPMVWGMLRPHAEAVDTDGAIDESYDPAAGQYSLSYVPGSSRITDILIPKDAYPSGYKVELSGACYDDSTGDLRIRADGTAKVQLVIRGN